MILGGFLKKKTINGVFPSVTKASCDFSNKIKMVIAGFDPFIMKDMP